MATYLIIQTAFIGDVVLATALVESIIDKEPDAKIDFLVRKGNEPLLNEHPHLNEVLIWDKTSSKYKHLKILASEIKKRAYDVLINLQRFGSTGFIAWQSKAKMIVGFNKNPFSFCYNHKIIHKIGGGKHEIDRNHELLLVLDDYKKKNPKLYPSDAQKRKIDQLLESPKFIVLAPSSVWFTKQLPKEKWIELMNQYSNEFIYLIGGPSDSDYLDSIGNSSNTQRWSNMAGKLNLLESAYLISQSKMTHVNDSAPLHLASAMNAAVTAYFCSTIPDFGFGPLSENTRVVQITQKLDCRPCGLHGKKSCPKNHFDCGNKIDVTIPN